ncbi:mediator complex, subunit Med18 [Stachybotrys elegans]|uniref:Mediator of RNA polymerase II transcription subunit 18 n=1 Tax=Stachybotrys elegans TaxID=80388 RepID=A0A8K0SL12_9HYPO|nr:mediator complex, subunit Med18 [Stachybotrys elegans]
MYELSLTATVEASDLDATCAVLSGVCGMPPWESIQRVLYFQGPPRPAGISNQSSNDKPIRKETTGQVWKELHQNLSRQSYVLQARYEVSKDDGMGPNAPPMDLDATPGILRWTDFPDPPRGQPLLIQRKKIELWDQTRIPSILRDNQHQFKNETIEETYRFVRDDVEFTLVRHHPIRPIVEYVPFETRTNAPAPPISNLPSWESLAPIDQQDRWILQVKTHVLQDNQPEEIRKAQEKLLAIRSEFDGVFNFRPIDRKVYDTRIAQQPQGIQALPQRVTLGKV